MNLHYKAQLVNVKEIIALYSKYHTKPTDTICGKNGEYFNVKVHGVYTAITAL
jgi:hypothetical protein